METIEIQSVSDAGDGVNVTAQGTVDGKPFLATLPKSSLDGLPSDAQRRLTVALALQAASDKANPPSSNLGGTVTITPTTVSVSKSSIRG